MYMYETCGHSICDVFYKDSVLRWYPLFKMYTVCLVV